VLPIHKPEALFIQRVPVVATFYVLPPRPLIRDQLARSLAQWFPGLHIAGPQCDSIAEGLAAALDCSPNVFVVQREELPLGEKVHDAIIEHFGAEEGDEIVLVDLGDL
jgi:hypothetical protein